VDWEVGQNHKYYSNPIEQVWPLVKDAFYDKKGSYKKLSDRVKLFGYVCKTLYSDTMAGHSKKLYSTMTLRIANKGWRSRF
jgi:hypothetical protein